jgi:hypothetical protein
VVLVPLSPEDIHAFDVARRKRNESEKRNLSEPQINSERKTPMLSHHKNTTENKRVTQENKCFLVSKSDLPELRYNTAPFFVLMYKEPFIYSNKLPSTFPSVVQILLPEFEDVFPDEVPPDLHQYVELNTKLT